MKTSLLAHFFGIHGSNNFVDETGKIISAFGSVQHTNDQSKFDTTSAYFDGDDYLHVPYSSDFGLTARRLYG